MDKDGDTRNWVNGVSFSTFGLDQKDLIRGTKVNGDEW